MTPASHGLLLGPATVGLISVASFLQNNRTTSWKCHVSQLAIDRPLECTGIWMNGDDIY
jgi:hypothetical protein